MQHSDTEFLGQLEDELMTAILKELPAERRLAGLTPEQRLAGLSPDELLKRLSIEERLQDPSPEAIRNALKNEPKMQSRESSAQSSENERR